MSLLSCKCLHIDKRRWINKSFILRYGFLSLVLDMRWCLETLIKNCVRVMYCRRSCVFLYAWRFLNLLSSIPKVAVKNVHLACTIGCISPSFTHAIGSLWCHPFQNQIDTALCTCRVLSTVIFLNPRCLLTVLSSVQQSRFQCLILVSVIC